MMIARYLIAGLIATTALYAITRIGKPRAPYTATDAIVSLIFSSFYVVLLVR